MSKKIIALILCVLFIALLSACSNDKNAANKDNLVVAKVDGEAIYYREYQKNLSDFLYNTYGMIESKMDEAFGEDNANNIRENIVDELISKRLLKKQAKELGLTNFTAEQKNTIKKNAEDFLTDLREQCTTEVKEDNERKGITMSEKELGTAVLAKYNKYVSDKGYTQEYITNYYTDELILSLMKDYIYGDVTASDSEVKSYYDKELANQTSTAQDSNITALQNYFSGAYEINLYIPEGISNVKHVLIALPNDVTSADLQEGLAKIKPKAQQALDLLNQGKDIDEVIAAYGNDEDMLKDEVKKNGYEICLGASDKPIELQIAASKLKEDGSISGLIETKSGFYIVKLLSHAKSGSIDFETIKDKIKTIIENNKKAELWNNNLEKLKSAANIEKFDENYIPPTYEELMS